MRDLGRKTVVREVTESSMAGLSEFLCGSSRRTAVSIAIRPVWQGGQKAHGNPPGVCQKAPEGLADHTKQKENFVGALRL